MRLDPGTQAELLGVDKVQRDIQSIRSWPFELASLAKVLTLILSVTAILLSRIIGQLLGI